jgi:hypothetical protein
VSLPEISAQNFAIYARFLLTGYLFVHELDAEPRTSDEEIQKALDTHFPRLLNLLSTASYLQSVTFQDAIIDAIIESLIHFRDTKTSKPARIIFSASYIKEIYRHTSKGSPVRRLFVGCNLFNLDRGDYQSRDFSEYPPEYLSDHLKAAGPFITATKKNKHDPIDLEKSCDYHEHTLRGEPCYKLKNHYITKTTSATGMSASFAVMMSGT